MRLVIIPLILWGVVLGMNFVMIIKHKKKTVPVLLFVMALSQITMTIIRFEEESNCT